MLTLRFNLFFAPADSESGGTPLTTGDTYDFLKDDSSTDDDKPFDLDEDTEKVEDKSTSKEEDSDSDDSDKDESDEEDDDEKSAEDELKELEEETDDEKKDDEEDLEQLAVPVSRKEILKKYPNIFKDFPYLQASWFREREFTKRFPTIQDAEQAYQDSQILQNFDADLSKGDTSRVLEAVKKSNPEAFAQIADNYLEVLNKVDRNAYLNVLGNVVKSTVHNMLRDAQASNNSALLAAAKTLNQFVFGTDTPEPLTRLSTEKKDDPERKKLEEERRKFAEQKFEDARRSVNTRINNSLKATIDANIDPNQSMTDYLRSKASGDAMDKVVGLIEKDKAFGSLVGKLWANAERNNYDSESMDKISRAYRSKAKVLLPAVLKAARSEALRGMGRRSSEPRAPRNTEDNKSSTRRESTSPRNSGSVNLRGNPSEEAKKIPKNVSTRDFLMSD